jgi:hypothetical protein
MLKHFNTFKKPLLIMALALTAGLSSQPAYAFGKKPITVPTTPVTPVKPPVTPVKPPVTPVTPTDPTVDLIRARWDATRDGTAWSQYIYDQLPVIAPNLLSKAPADIAQYCPAYSSLSVGDKKNFWVYLVSSVAQLESSFNPATVYTESFTDSSGKKVQSIGLLQLSITDNSYGCGFTSATDIQNADKNLACGLRILNKLVGQNGQLAGQSSSGAWLGGARYWSTLRSAKATEIKGWTNALRMCAN